MLDSDDYRFRPRVLIARVRPALRGCKKGLPQKMKQPPGMIEAAVREARDTALREAAALCDALEHDCHGLCAEAIRALIDLEKQSRGSDSDQGEA